MIVKVLGSSGSRIQGKQTSCLLIDDNVVLDAGGITARLTLEEQVAIDHVLISHAHLDHIYDLPFLADNVMTERSEPLRVWAPQEVLDVLSTHLFNDEVWPDLTRLNIQNRKILEMCPLRPGEETSVGSLLVSWERTNHTVFSAGYLLSREAVSVLYSGDTSSTDAIWMLGRSKQPLDAVFVETSYPDRLVDMAKLAGHLSPCMLAGELEKLNMPDTPVKVFHLKQQYHDEISEDLLAHKIQCQILEGHECFDFANRCIN